jgi:hypothetical protein
MCQFHQTVDTARGQQLARELGIPFFETSAKEGINVDAAFEALIMDVYAKSYGALGGAPTTVGGVVKLAASEKAKAAANAAGAAKPSECCS